MLNHNEPTETYQVMPPLDPDVYQNLYDDIRVNGVHTPIHVDENGVIIDGHHRSKIANELGIPCPVITRDDLDDAQKRSMAYSLNLHRRHLNREQKRELIAQSLKDDPQLSNREHARRTGVSDKTVGSVRGDLESTAEIPQSAERVSADGRVRPASQPPHPIGPGDLDELNTPRPDESKIVKPLDDNYHDPKAPLTDLMVRHRKAVKALRELLYAVQHLDRWDDGPVTGDLRALLDDIDAAVEGGGLDAELRRLTGE